MPPDRNTPPPIPDLRVGLLHKLVDALADRISGKHREKCVGPHCDCYKSLRVKFGLVFAAFILVFATLVRREIMSYVPRVADAPIPITPGNRMPGIDPSR